MKQGVLYYRLRALTTVAMLLSTALVQAQDPVWSDEFNGSSIDRSIWTPKTGGDGNGNGELQYYTASENAYVEDGNLVIEARKEDYEGKSFTSARLRTLGRFTYRFGTLEARIKLPNVADGLWPAFWLMGNNFGQVGWPKCGEVDIMEVGAKSAIDSGTVNRTVSAAAHWWQEDGTWSDWLQADYAQTATVDDTFYEDYHRFQLDWTPERIIISVDDTPYFEMDITDPNLSELVDNPAFIILNLAVGGFNFVELTDPAQITAAFPAKMYIDYVRLYENEHTELYPSEEVAYRNNYGVFTETTTVDNELNFGASSTNLYIWNNLEVVGTAAAEGGSVLSYSVASGDWWGMGISSADQNMKYYANGYLHFQCKTTATVPITISIASSAADGSGVELVPGEEEYGLVRDGQWHSVAIPLNKFSNVDFNTVKTLFSVSGGDPGSAVEIAFDDIYWSESVKLPTPEFGNFGVYTENSANKDAGEFGFGVNGDLFIWENTLTITETAPAEGNASLSFTSNNKGWYGLGLTARTAHNLSAFDNPEGAFHFSMKTSSDADFRIGMKSGNLKDIGQQWIWFKNGQDPYNFVRDGAWHEVTIPIADLANGLDLMEVTQLFQVLGAGEISDIAFDNIYFSGGQAATDPGTDGVPVNRPPTAVIRTSEKGGPAPLALEVDASQSTDVNGDALTYAWDFGDGTMATGATAQHTYATDGTYTLTLTVSDSASSGVATQLIVVGNTFGLAKSDKRGLGFGSHSEADMAALSAGITWWYNWFHQPDAQVADVYQNYGMEFVPMAWNGGFNEQAMRTYLSTHPDVKYVLGWNEPNFIDQANMTPSQAAAEWPRLEAIADEYNLKIVSPAMNFCGNCVTENGTTYYDPVEYFDDFFAACSDCRVDALSVHAYMGTIGALEWYIDLFEKYGKPIWLTEFANWENNPTLDDQKRFLAQSVDYLENDPRVERYAWFTGRHQGPPYMALLEKQSGVLTELGQMYINMPVHDPAIYYAVPGRVEAESYTKMQGVRPEPTQDTNGFLNLTEIASGDWVEYQIEVAAGGTFTLTLRVASDSAGGTINVLLDNTSQGTVSFDVTGGVQSWQDVSTSLEMPAGKHTLRLAVTGGRFGINYLTVGESDGGTTDEPEAGSDNLALNRPASSSTHDGPFVATAANDGDKQTRWSSAFVSPSWLRVDLGQSYDIRRVVLDWERASAESYSVMVSDVNSTPDPDSDDWTVISTQTGRADEARVDELSNLSGSGRYVAVYATNKVHPWGYSLWELEVYGAGTAASSARQRWSTSGPELTVYPNPVSETLRLGSKSWQEGDQIEVFSALGQRMMQQAVKSRESSIDVSTLPAGVYTLRLSGTRSQTLRFIKE